MTSSRDLPWFGKRGRRARHADSYKPDDRLDLDRSPHGRHLSARDLAAPLIIATVIVTLTIHFVRLG